jgi:hypothetical protein
MLQVNRAPILRPHVCCEETSTGWTGMVANLIRLFEKPEGSRCPGVPWICVNPEEVTALAAPALECLRLGCFMAVQAI